MSQYNSVKTRAWILVKAYPQPSQKYQETVCCAAITDDGRILRLYPIRYRQLNEDQKFNRFDLIEFEMWKSESDARPESYKVKEETIKIISLGSKADAQSKYQLWSPFVEDSIVSLQNQEKVNKKSLGIVKPDTDSLLFHAKSTEGESESVELLKELNIQGNLFGKTLAPLEIDYVFYYKFKINDKQHNMQIHDWEAQATYYNFKRDYGKADAIGKMSEFYNQKIKQQNPHFIMGNVGARPSQFMIIGILRSSKIITEQISIF